MALAINTSRISPNRSVRRSKIRRIVIHHWNDPKTPGSLAGVVSWLTSTRSRVSAHYVVSGTTVYRLVPESVVAWHAAGGNQDSIGIECDPRQQDSTYETVAALIRDIRSRYGALPLVRHRDVKGSLTACPGTYDLGRLDRLARGVKPVNPGAVKSATTKPKGAGKLTVDGRYGKATHSEVQRRRGRPVDGRLGLGDLADLCTFLGLPEYDKISDQPRKATELGNGIVPAIWDHDPDHKGPNSKFVRALEAYAGATVDRGSWEPGLTRQIQVMLNSFPAFLTDADKGIAAKRIRDAGVN